MWRKTLGYNEYTNSGLKHHIISEFHDDKTFWKIQNRTNSKRYGGGKRERERGDFFFRRTCPGSATMVETRV